MSYWLVQSDTTFQAWPDAIPQDIFCPNWDGLPDLSHVGNPRELKEVLKKALPDETPEGLQRKTDRIWRFIDEMVPGDIIIVPALADLFVCGEILGPYRYDSEGREPLRHQREVRWLKEGIALDKFAPKTQELLKSGLELARIDETTMRNDINQKLSLPVNNALKYMLWVMLLLLGMRLLNSLATYLQELHGKL